MNQNPTLTLLHTRRSVKAKDLKAPGPTDDELQHIIRAGIRVPDHKKLNPWKIKILGEDGQQKLGTLCADIMRAKEPDKKDKKYEMEETRFQRAPVVLAVLSLPDESKFLKVPLIEQQLSAGAVCQNILLAATSLGYGAQWLTEWPAYDAQVKTALGASGQNDTIAGFIYIGTASETPTDRDRPDWDAVVEWF